jgi:hypothetical protein
MENHTIFPDKRNPIKLRIKHVYEISSAKRTAVEFHNPVLPTRPVPGVRNSGNALLDKIAAVDYRKTI